MRLLPTSLRVGECRSARPAGPVAARVDRAAVRARAREAGLAVSARGRISAEIMSRYEAAH